MAEFQFPSKFAGIKKAKFTSQANNIKIMKQYNQVKNPKWWTKDNDSAWDRVKEAMKRDWDQTKHDFGGDEPDTNQNIRNTVKQASGTETIPPRHETTYEEWEPAYRFGYGARQKYGTEYDDELDWDDEMESTLKEDWQSIAPERKQTWMQDRAAIRYGWDYDADEILDEDDDK
jgi:hypothetical protein